MDSVANTASETRAEEGMGASMETVPKLKIVFMGTPDFAAQSLKALAEWDGCDVVAVYTQPDRPAGRGQQFRPSPVKVLALEHGYPVLQPLNFKDQADIDTLCAFEADVLVVAAYGLILPQAVLDAGRMGAINVHASLLPRYRGAAPIQRAIMNGDPVTGVTIMQVVKALDAGPMLLQRAIAIGIDDTSATMHDELADLGGRLLITTLERMAAGPVAAMPQDAERVTYAAKLTKDDGLIDWNRPAREVHAHIRGVTPWPAPHCTLELKGRKPMKVNLEAGSIGADLPADRQYGAGALVGLVRFVAEHGASEEDGTKAMEDALAFACADKLYLVKKIRPADKKPMDAKAFWNGYVAPIVAQLAEGEPVGMAILPQNAL